MTPVSARERTAASRAYIAIADAAFSYEQDHQSRTILAGLHLKIKEGEAFCLLGPTGCGKTTVLRLIAGFENVSAGSIRVDGRDVNQPGVDRGVVFQGDDSLFPWLSALDNISFGPSVRGVGREARTEIALRFLRLVGLDERDASKYPSQLSGGMKQRIQIARVLANDPKVLLMDEPFAALDAQTRSELQDEVVSIWSKTGKTMLFITHDIGEAILIGDRIGIMRAGPESNVRTVVEVSLSRPRSRADPQFGELYESLNQLIREEVVRGREGHDGDHE